MTVKLKKKSNSPKTRKQKTTIVERFKKIFRKPQKSNRSYTPTINKQLVSIKTKKRVIIKDCNNTKAFQLKEPLKISIPGYFYGRYCVPYYEKPAKDFLLKQLAANKHINPFKIIPPKQILANCWFNAMFVTFFVSDKGRKFFHYFRQLMITGKQVDGKEVAPDKLRDAFALLNFGVESALTGNSFAYTLNTNAVIEKVYNAIPDTYKVDEYFRNVKEAGNPLLYYMSIVNFLDNKSIQIFYLKNATETWRETLLKEVNTEKPPHVIVLEIYSDDAPSIQDKPVYLQVNNIRYAIDSAVLRDITGRHFSTVLTAERKEMGYDGLSYHRLKTIPWRDNLNRDYSWGFAGSKTASGAALQWNFMKSYQLLFYYRVSK